MMGNVDAVPKDRSVAWHHGLALSARAEMREIDASHGVTERGNPFNSPDGKLARLFVLLVDLTK
jgi:hypothetical protein